MSCKIISDYLGNVPACRVHAGTFPSGCNGTLPSGFGLSDDANYEVYC